MHSPALLPPLHCSAHYYRSSGRYFYASGDIDGKKKEMAQRHGCIVCLLYGLPGTVCIVLIVNNNSHVFNQRMLHLLIHTVYVIVRERKREKFHRPPI